MSFPYASSGSEEHVGPNSDMFKGPRGPNPNPNEQKPNAGPTNLPPGSVPPGARFDPVGPPTSTGFRAGPDNDDLKMPGFE